MKNDLSRQQFYEAKVLDSIEKTKNECINETILDHVFSAFYFCGKYEDKIPLAFGRKAVALLIEKIRGGEK